MGDILDQSGGTSATGDLTNAIGNSRLSALCPGTGNTVSTSIVADVIEKAEAETLSILGPTFNVSTAYSKTIVKVHCCDIAVYRAYCRVPEFRNDRGETIVTPQYEKAVKALEKIRDGDRDMGDETSTGKSKLVGGVLNASTKKFIVEPDEGTSDGPTGGF